MKDFEEPKPFRKLFRKQIGVILENSSKPHCVICGRAITGQGIAVCLSDDNSRFIDARANKNGWLIGLGCFRLHKEFFQQLGYRGE